jgi:hypothetical protein
VSSATHAAVGYGVPSFPFVPFIVAQLVDADREKLNGVPISREHNAAWLKYFGDLQSPPLLKSPVDGHDSGFNQTYPACGVSAQDDARV